MGLKLLRTVEIKVCKRLRKRRKGCDKVDRTKFEIIEDRLKVRNG